jgi:hypothetical protein
VALAVQAVLVAS